MDSIIPDPIQLKAERAHPATDVDAIRDKLLASAVDIVGREIKKAHGDGGTRFCLEYSTLRGALTNSIKEIVALPAGAIGNLSPFHVSSRILFLLPDAKIHEHVLHVLKARSTIYQIQNTKKHSFSCKCPHPRVGEGCIPCFEVSWG